MTKKWKTIFAGAFHLVMPPEWSIPEISAYPRPRGGGLFWERILLGHSPTINVYTFVKHSKKSTTIMYLKAYYLKEYLFNTDMLNLP
jgi:hypothetical protein